MTDENERPARGAAVRDGMRRAAASGKHVGRSRGAVKSEDELLREHAAVVEALTAGDYLREAAERAGVAVNTVRKVRALLPEGFTTRKAHSSSRLPLRPVAVSIADWHRVSGKRGDLLVCGHFVPEAEWEVGKPRKTRRCPYCAKGKKDLSLPAYAVTFLQRPWEMERKTLELTYHRPLLLNAPSEEAALARVRKSLGWRKLPEGTEVWEVTDPSTVGAGTLSPRTVKALALLEANRVLAWSPRHSEGGGIYIVKEGQFQPRASLRLSYDECRALWGNRFINQHRTVFSITTHDTFAGRSALYLNKVKMGWLISWNGRDALYTHDQRAHVSRTYHEFNEGLLDW